MVAKSMRDKKAVAACDECRRWIHFCIIHFTQYLKFTWLQNWFVAQTG